MFSVIRRSVGELLVPNQPLVTAMDDTLLHKRGRKVFGTAWRRDPLGPPFHPNLIWGQRFLQVSAALPAGDGQSWARMVPIAMQHCPTPKRPRPNADAQQWKEYKQAQRHMALSNQAAQRLISLRKEMDAEEVNRQRQLICAVDGGYTNRKLFKEMPQRTILIGRIRKDAKLYNIAQPSEAQRGRRRNYGELLPTPEQIRKDTSIPWQHVQAWAAGKLHQFRIKFITPIRWRTAGADKNLQLVIIAPLAYRLTKRSKLLYRKPAYLICTDTQLPIDQLLQFYLWRWDIELNFRDEKTLLGIGKAQVRHPNSVEQLPQFITAAYAMLQLAVWKAFGPLTPKKGLIPIPKWQKNTSLKRPSTQKCISRLRVELWGKAMGLDNFSHFEAHIKRIQNYKKDTPNLQTAILLAQR